MSYILDALRKSDQQRQRGAAPTLLAVQTAAIAPKQPALLTYGLLAVVLVGAGVVIGWLRPWQTQQAVPHTPVAVIVKPLESIPRVQGPAPSVVAPRPPSPELQAAQTESAPSETAPQSKDTTQPAETAAAGSGKAPPAKAKPLARAKPEMDGPPRETAATAPEKAAAPAPQRSADIAASDATSGPPVISMAELPPQVREALPVMTISVHGYSDNPEGRLVGINYRILREGDSVVPGLELQQITPDGMIFSFKGFRFRRGVK
ncbi:MAG TPA: general secretion pathway protein GspB [Burkholderiales bacterium]|nr:general secretion pathway protein GspB [Burkholderiales bacterium]